MRGIRATFHIVVVLVALGAGTSNRSLAQDATLSGFITDESNGRPLELVNVVVRAEDGSIRGATTNRDGLYLLPGLEPGEYVFEASYIGYETFTDTLNLEADQNLTRSIALVPTAEGLDEVIVESERTGGTARVIAGQQTVRAADIEQIPAPDVQGDLVSFLSAQPGIVSTGDRGGQLFIRGGEPSQNLVQIDGMMLYQPFHILGFYSAFPTDIINQVDVYAGGYGSQFGGKISSVIDISARLGNTRRYAGAVSVSPFVSSVTLEGPIYPNKASIIASVRRSNLDNGASQYVDAPMPFEFGDAFVKLHTTVSANSRASVTGLKTYDRGVLAEDTGGQAPEEIRWENEAIGFRYLILPRIVSIMADLHVSYSRYRTELGDPDAPHRTSRIENIFVALDASYLGDRVDAYAGSSLRTSELYSEIGGLYQNVDLRLSNVSNWGSYLSFEIDVGRGLSVRPGLRAQFYRVRFNPYLEPRIKAVWELGKHRLSSAFGLYHQEIIGISDRRDAASVFTVWTNIPRENPNVPDPLEGKIQRAMHAILGYGVAPAPWIELSVEGFYKKLTNLFITEWTAFPQLTTRLQSAHGRSFGADVRLDIRRPNYYGFVNYGLSSTRYVADAKTFAVWYGDERPVFRPPHDRRHQVNAVAGAQLAGFDVSLRWEFGSGLPFSRALGFDGFAIVDDIEKASEIPATRRVIYEKPYNAVLPTYHRLDASVERTFDVGDVSLTAQASVINLYDRRNLFYVDVFTLRQVDQLPFVPSFGLRIEYN